MVMKHPEIRERDHCRKDWPEAHLPQLLLGLSQRCLLLLKLGQCSIHSDAFRLYHPIQPPIHLQRDGQAVGLLLTHSPASFLLTWVFHSPSFLLCASPPSQACLTAPHPIPPLLTSMARTHMQRDLAASETRPMMSGWKSGWAQ